MLSASQGHLQEDADYHLATRLRTHTPIEAVSRRQGGQGDCRAHVRKTKLKYPLMGDEDKLDVSEYFRVNDLAQKPHLWPHSYDELRAQGIPVSRMDRKILEPAGDHMKLASFPLTARANFIPGGCLLDVCLTY